MPRKGRKTLKKGGFYSFTGDVGTGAAKWTSHSEMGDYSISNRGGNTFYGAGRKRKGKGKGKGKGKTRRRMRGGSKYGEVSASYQGTGDRGFANYVGISPNKPGFATQGEFNNYGAQPGSGHASFLHN